MNYIIDRFEGKIAVLEGEDRSIANVEKNRLPKRAKEGDWLKLHKDGSYSIDNACMEKHLREAKKLIDELFK